MTNEENIEEKQTKPTSIRVDEDILERVKQEAKTQKRSISKQIEYCIAKYFEIQDGFKK